MIIHGVNKLDHVVLEGNEDGLKSTTADSGVVYFYRDRSNTSLVHVFDGEEYVESLNIVEVINLLTAQEE